MPAATTRNETHDVDITDANIELFAKIGVQLQIGDTVRLAFDMTRKGAVTAAEIEYTRETGTYAEEIDPIAAACLIDESEDIPTAGFRALSVSETEKWASEQVTEEEQPEEEPEPVAEPAPDEPVDPVKPKAKPRASPKPRTPGPNRGLQNVDTEAVDEKGGGGRQLDADLEDMLEQESLGGFDATKKTYDTIIDLRIVTPQVPRPFDTVFKC